MKMILWMLVMSTRYKKWWKSVYYGPFWSQKWWSLILYYTTDILLHSHRPTYMLENGDVRSRSALPQKWQLMSLTVLTRKLHDNTWSSQSYCICYVTQRCWLESCDLDWSRTRVTICVTWLGLAKKWLGLARKWLGLARKWLGLARKWLGLARKWLVTNASQKLLERPRDLIIFKNSPRPKRCVSGSPPLPRKTRQNLPYLEFF